jgi:hypothetical protein
MEDSKDLILLVKIYMGPRKNFLGTYRQLRREPSERFASPGIVDCGRR